MSRAHDSISLRTDLNTISVSTGTRDSRIVIDEISGRFSRVSERLWQRIQAGDSDPSLAHQARLAGWTQTRIEVKRNRFSFLAIRIPLGSIDPFAKWVAHYSGIVFSPIAIAFWSLWIVIAFALTLSRSSQLISMLGFLPHYLETSSPIWIGVTFLGTKLLHELAHAVMCRRMGARSKSVGVFLFCGIPCPYCDVTDIWKLPSALRRAAVMLAGIYVELIIASGATLVWCFASEVETRFFAMNLMLVCGVSTLVFNANPLMRYDGYFVLMDRLGSVNLRHEANDSFRSVVISRLAGSRFGRVRRTDSRAIGLSIYHLASMCYRIVVLVAIGTIVIHIANVFQLRVVGVTLVTLSAATILAHQFKKTFAVLHAKGDWMNVPFKRRLAFLSAIILVLAMILLVPIPRYRQLDGLVDVSDAVSVYLPIGSQIAKVETEFDRPVIAGDRLATLKDDDERFELARIESELRLAKIRSNLARERSLDQPEIAQQWSTLLSAEESAELMLVSARQKLKETEIVAPVSGIVIPSLTHHPDGVKRVWLGEQVGMVSRTQSPWCRISPERKRHATFALHPRDHDIISPGMSIRVYLNEQTGTFIDSEVQSTSSLEPTNDAIERDAMFQLTCPLPTVASDALVSSIGCRCRAVVRLSASSLATDVSNWFYEFVRGEI